MLIISLIFYTFFPLRLLRVLPPWLFFMDFQGENIESLRESFALIESELVSSAILFVCFSKI